MKAYNLIIVRLISILLVWVAWGNMPAPAFKALFLSVLFGHYLLSLYYAKNQVRNIIQKRVTWLPLLGLSLICAGYFYSGFYIAGFVPFIGFHIALSETYMLNQDQQANAVIPANTLWHLNLSRFLTSMSLFVMLLNGHEVFSKIPVEFLHVIVAMSFAYFFWSLPKESSGISKSIRMNFALYELSGLAVAYFLYLKQVPISFQLFVFYHVMSWIVYPTMTFYQKGNLPALRKFALHTIISTAIFFIMSSPWILNENTIDLGSVIPLWATLHFISSFALSNLNPRFIAKYFYPERTT